MTRRAVFLDKDGTLVENVPYNCEPHLVRLAEGAGAALAGLRDAGYALVVVSNQSGIARGYFGLDALLPVERRIQKLLRPFDVAIEAFYWCPHHPDAINSDFGVECDCRKPLPGMLQRAARELDLDLADSWMAGDILDDIEAGNRAGCRTALVDNGGETVWQGGPFRTPHLRAPSLPAVAQLILKTGTPVAEAAR